MIYMWLKYFECIFQLVEVDTVVSDSQSEEEEEELPDLQWNGKKQVNTKHFQLFTIAPSHAQQATYSALSPRIQQTAFPALSQNVQQTAFPATPEAEGLVLSSQCSKQQVKHCHPLCSKQRGNHCLLQSKQFTPILRLYVFSHISIGSFHLLAHLIRRIMWAFATTKHLSSLCPSIDANFSHFNLFLWNHWAKFEPAWHEWSLLAAIFIEKKGVKGVKIVHF